MHKPVYSAWSPSSLYTHAHTHTYAPTNVRLHTCTHTTPHTQYAVAVLLIVLLEIVAGILGFVYRDTLVSCYYANVAGLVASEANMSVHQPQEVLELWTKQ